MKTFYSLIFLALCFGSFSQVQYTGNDKASTSSLKSQYIAEQQFLFSKPQTALIYGDSLSDFDENAIKNKVAGHSVTGTELIGYLQIMKREHIRKKYFTTTANNQTAGASKNIGSVGTINTYPCVNEGFESTLPGTYTGATNSTAVQGWLITNQTNMGCTTNTVWSPGSPEFAIVATPIFNFPNIGTVPQSPLGGTVVAQLNNTSNGSAIKTKLSQTFPVTSSNSLFRFAYAGFYMDGTHLCCEQPDFAVNVLNAQGVVYPCSSMSLGFGTCSTSATYSYNTTNAAYWTNWTIKTIDLTPFIGTTITIEAINSDCFAGGHVGTTLFDASCSPQLIGMGCPCISIGIPNNVNFCAGSNLATIQAPMGYYTYSWVPPYTSTISSSQSTLSTITITNPVPGSVYTVNLVNTAGCMYLATYTLAYSAVSIAALAANPSCSMGTSGSATVLASGSGSGYNYSWYNSTNSVVSTSSVANNLSPGVYSVNVSSSAGCGTAAATATVGNAAPTTINIVKPYCASQPAYLSGGAGSNYQWYNLNTPIQSGQGGTASSYTVSFPQNNAIYRLSYLTAQGCRDSLIFTLTPSNGGTVGIVSNPTVCAGASNGTATISVTPGSNSPFNAFNYTVVSTGLTPSYSSTLSASQSNTFAATNLTGGGTYSVSAFDGTCFYGTTFSVNTYPTFNFTLTPTSSPTLCQGNSVAASVVFGTTVTSGYTYSWSPTQWLVGNQGAFQATIITPTTAPGTMTTITYTVAVASASLNCPVTRTLSVSVANPITPTVSYIGSMCSNAPAFTVNAFPSGGAFNGPGLNSGGLLTPSGANNGLNTFTYNNSLGGCNASTTGTFFINQSPALNVSGNLSLCTGQSTTLHATGANTYSWSNGSTNPNLVLSPSGTTTLMITGTNANSCTDSKTLTIQVDSMAFVSVVSSGSICSGHTATLTASGASSYSWNSAPGSNVMVVSPTVTTLYIVTAGSGNCTGSDSVLVVVGSSPNLSVSGDQTICVGQSALIIASGANSYIWSNNATSGVIGVNPTVTTAYVVTGSNGSSSCADSKTVTINVSDCTGLQANSFNNGRIYPNPASENLFIENAEYSDLTVYNELGMLVISKKIHQGTHVLNIASLAPGVYFIRLKGAENSVVHRVIKN